MTPISLQRNRCASVMHAPYELIGLELENRFLGGKSHLCRSSKKRHGNCIICFDPPLRAKECRMRDLFTRSNQAGSRPVVGHRDEQVLNLLAAEAIRLAHLATDLHLTATASDPESAHINDAAPREPRP